MAALVAAFLMGWPEGAAAADYRPSVFGYWAYDSWGDPFYGPGRKAAIESSLPGMIDWIIARTGWSIKPSPPRVRLMSHEYITRITNENSTLLFYDSMTDTIFADSRMPYETNIYAVAVLLHEVVHHVQFANDVFLDAPKNWPATKPYTLWDRLGLLESHAYALQDRFLKELGYRGAVYGYGCLYLTECDW